MNRLINESKQEVVSVGSEGSHIRNLTEYNLTMKKLIVKLNTRWSVGGLGRHCEHYELEWICEDSGVLKDKWTSLINTAYYYFIGGVSPINVNEI